MILYLLLMATGLLGLMVMAATGFLHGDNHSGHEHHSVSGHGQQGQHALGPGQGAHGQTGGHAAGGHHMDVGHASHGHGGHIAAQSHAHHVDVGHASHGHGPHVGAQSHAHHVDVAHASHGNGPHVGAQSHAHHVDIGHASRGHGSHVGAQSHGHHPDAGHASQGHGQIADGQGSMKGDGGAHALSRGEATALQDNPNADGDAQGDGSLLHTGLMWLMPLMSPLNWFSWFLGAGAAGSIATLAGLPAPAAFGLAIGGALGFNKGVVKPIWSTVFSFASTPAGNLEACMLQEVEAITRFNDRGEGLVRVCIDGHSEDILARLTRLELERGRRIRKGDRLLIEEVDPKTSSVRVSRI